MSIIAALQTYLLTFTSLEANAPLWVNFLESDPTEYSVSPLPGSIVIETYINGSSLRQFNFAFSSMESTADDLARLQNIGFYEAFAEWLESQSDAGTLPTLGAGQTAERIEATGWGYLFEEGESQTGIYQIQCRLVFHQA